ncbi:hypothetical protein RFZ01_05700, partial [Acinetobacter pittii]|uniref:hypothetical protein n=1 Tax=Acinetobacter pittii TaxID=48296 RepID=UPI002813A7AC
KLKDNRHRLGIYLERYKGLSPLGRLNQGFAFAADKEGRAVTQISQTEPGDLLEISVTDGVIQAEVIATRKE